MSTIRDVASLAGVSAATVSRVLNHDTKYKMTDETIEKVWKAVADLNYKAPSSASDHMRHVRNSATPGANVHRFGCVLNIQGSKYNDPYYLTILSGFENEIMRRGYELGFVRTYTELENPEVLYKTFSEPVSGILVMNTPSDEYYEYIKKRTSNIVGIDTDFTSIDNIAYDHFQVSFKAVEYLVSKGYKKIGYIGGFGDYINTSRRFNGFYAALRCYGVEYNPDWVLPSNWNEAFLFDQLKQAKANNKLPEAYFVASDHMAIAALRSFYDLGVSVPSEVAVMGLSNIEVSKYSTPPLSTVGIPIYEMGQVAANVLFERLAGDKTPPKHITLGCTIIERSST